MPHSADGAFFLPMLCSAAGAETSRNDGTVAGSTRGDQTSSHAPETEVKRRSFSAVRAVVILGLKGQGDSAMSASRMTVVKLGATALMVCAGAFAASAQSARSTEILIT